MKVLLLLAYIFLTGCSVTKTSFAESSIQTCTASYYGHGDGFHGKTMANGKRFDKNNSTLIAHKTLPFGTRIRVTNVQNGRSIIAHVSDRGPYVHGRCVDVSYAGAQKLGFVQAGTTHVRVEIF